MPAFLVEYPDIPGLTLPEGANKFVVFASNAANARSMVAGHFTGDQNAFITSADMTVTEVIAATEAAMTGYNLFIQQIGAAAGDYVVRADSGESHTVTSSGQGHDSHLQL